jgi:hypothetical protein
MTCGHEEVIMRQGERWWLDDGKLHESFNPSDEGRVHPIFNLLRSGAVKSSPRLIHAWSI